MPHDIAVRPIAWAGVAIACTVGLVVAAVFLLLRLWHEPAGADRASERAPVEIRGATLQSAPQLDMEAYRQEKQRLMQATGWVDASHGIARIPVADAMALLAARAASAASGVRP